MAGFTVFGMLLNFFFLEKYYVFSSKALFTAAEKKIRSVPSGRDNIQPLIEEIDRFDGISVIIADDHDAILLSSFDRRMENPHLPKGTSDLIRQAGDKLQKKAVYTIDDEIGKKPRLTYIFMDVPGRYIILTKPLNAIRESAHIAGRFFLFAGLIMLAAGSFFMFRFSAAVTKPVIEMSEIARDISDLNFGRKVSVQSSNEIGLLAGSINTLSDKLKKSIDGLKKDIEFQKTLSRNVSHELKTPIGIIKGYAEGLLYGVADSPDMRRKYIEVIAGECDRMDGLVRDMLMLSRLSAQNYVLDAVVDSPVDRLFKDIRERFSHELSEKGITLSIEENCTRTIRGNYDLVFLAVSNLVSNAIKYNDENRYIRLASAETAGGTSISVFNTCSGIPENEMPKIFDEFYMIDKARSRERGGHGLGLSIVKSIAALHKGSITVENRKGGVEFCFTLPAEPV